MGLGSLKDMGAISKKNSLLSEVGAWPMGDATLDGAARQRGGDMNTKPSPLCDLKQI